MNNQNVFFKIFYTTYDINEVPEAHEEVIYDSNKIKERINDLKEQYGDYFEENALQIFKFTQESVNINNL